MTAGSAGRDGGALDGAMRLSLSGCTADLDARVAIRDGVELQLSRRDWDLLRYLAERAGQAVSRERLMVDVLGYAATADSRALDASVSRLRAKIELHPNEPVHVITVYGHGYRLDPEAGAPVAAVPAVPAPVGLAALLDRGDVTLVGPAGIGKTHLALAAARALDPSVVVVDLTDPPAAIADRDGWIVLDGAELAPELAIGFLARPHRARVVVTARERLGWSGEVVHRVPELGVDAGVALFVARAARIGVHGFDAAELGAIASLVVALDGLPLAIAYAATRTLILRPEELLRELERDLALVMTAETGSGTLATAVGWTWSRLEPWERQAVSQLATFDGGFTLDAARAVVVLDAGPPLFDVLQALVDRCLCRRLGASPRYAVYRAIREFAADRLTVLPYHRDALRRFVAWCARVASAGPDDPTVRAEAANLRAARLVAGVFDPHAAQIITAALDG